ncbi:hypothetical protein HMPREF0578_2155 [Mobiluncus mulieris 28-1]|uniref:Uncharacterized protein n=1 Tax=Mobiluncus mulieris ATCC 35239 TaxID=871571 RepID=E0QRX7_9ACTO|nr:hypothetical protein HMPREF0578_2155 [Mobiluncus mulieris 28-1]EFM45835.1 hypothetical protein HMPREF0580_1642 [Mobiluncus mulieris ATCC 35239]
MASLRIGFVRFMRCHPGFSAKVSGGSPFETRAFAVVFHSLIAFGQWQ